MLLVQRVAEPLQATAHLISEPALEVRGFALPLCLCWRRLQWLPLPSIGFLVFVHLEKRLNLSSVSLTVSQKRFYGP